VAAGHKGDGALVAGGYPSMGVLAERVQAEED
jgi:hypothetical protein